MTKMNRPDQRVDQSQHERDDERRREERVDGDRRKDVWQRDQRDGVDDPRE